MWQLRTCWPIDTGLQYLWEIFLAVRVGKSLIRFSRDRESLVFLWAKERKCDLLGFFWANRTFALFTEVHERIAHIRSFFISDLSKLHRSQNRSRRSLKKGEWVKIEVSKDRCEQRSMWAKIDVNDLLLGINKGENCQKHTKNTNFSSKSLVFWKRFAHISSKSTHIALF